METRILVIKMVPGFCDEALGSIFALPSVRAVVLELYGTGNAPSAKAGMMQALAVAREKNVLIVATTQCRKGGIVMGTYEVGVRMRDAGVVAAGDMTTEAVATKLAYLYGRLGDRATPETMRRFMGQSLRGEISPPERYTRPFFENALGIPDTTPGTPLSQSGSSASLALLSGLPSTPGRSPSPPPLGARAHLGSTDGLARTERLFPVKKGDDAALTTAEGRAEVERNRRDRRIRDNHEASMSDEERRARRARRRTFPRIGAAGAGAGTGTPAVVRKPGLSLRNRDDVMFLFGGAAMVGLGLALGAGLVGAARGSRAQAGRR